jgi:hypothetical protein
MLFFFVKYLPEDGQKRPKYIGGLLYTQLYAFVSNYCEVVGINIVKLSYCMEHG